MTPYNICLGAYILLPEHKKYTCNVLDFNPNKQYDRIFAAFNSFCLITKDIEIHNFFNNLASLCKPNGLISLSYYPKDHWDDPSEFDFILNGKKISYYSTYKISQTDPTQARWFDHYQIDGHSYHYQFPIKLYHSDEILISYTKRNQLQLVDKINNYNKKDISIPGWIEYVFEKI